MTNVSDDPLINKDANFLDAVRNVFEGNETSIIFKPHLKKMKAVFYEAQRSIKKRIKEVHSNTIFEQGDRGNKMLFMRRREGGGGEGDHQMIALPAVLNDNLS